MPRRRRATVTVNFVLAVITGQGAVVSTWVKRQALDTSNWTDTSSKLLADSKIQSALGLYLANELFTSVADGQGVRVQATACGPQWWRQRGGDQQGR